MHCRKRNNKRSYVNLKPGKGCSSHVGRKYRRKGQDITLDIGCFKKMKILHEFIHAWGFYHEHSQMDRDEYVTIYPENIKPGKEGNFKIKKYSNDFSVPYDGSSIMHYSIFAFGRKDAGKELITILSKVKLLVFYILLAFPYP